MGWDIFSGFCFEGCMEIGPGLSFDHLNIHSLQNLSVGDEKKAVMDKETCKMIASVEFCHMKLKNRQLQEI